MSKIELQIAKVLILVFLGLEFLLISFSILYFKENLIDILFSKYFFLESLIALVITTAAVIIFRNYVGKYIDHLKKINNSSSSSFSHYSLTHIPNNEIGELIKSREGMVVGTEELLEKNRTLLRTLSHDLSNLLTIGIASCNSLKKTMPTTDSAKVEINIKRLEKSLQRQLELIDMIRKMDAIESGKTNIPLEPIEISQILSETRFSIDEKIAKKEMILNININPSVQSRKVLTNKAIIVNSVLVNILSNSIKFSQDRSKIEINFEFTNENTRILISDNGIGITKDMLPKLFDTTFATSRLGLNGEPGTGFGMPLAYRAMKRMNGNLTVQSISKDDSEDKSGTTFIVTVPLCL